jgi:hypothetical protein
MKTLSTSFSTESQVLHCVVGNIFVSVLRRVGLLICIWSELDSIARKGGLNPISPTSTFGFIAGCFRIVRRDWFWG